MSGAPVVETSGGRIEGARVAAPDGAVLLRFLGVPYAAPPVGDGRFAPPAPVVPWPGVRPARAFGPSAPQAEGVPSRLPPFSVAPTDEDCLTLNVWTPDTSGSRPVLVWLHGGAYMSGGSAMAVFDGARLAAEGDAVVVTLNYRLGALGFLAFEPGRGDAVANCGLRDQLAALRWVHDHAAELGGDPARVTAFGESAGAGSILHLCVGRAAVPFRRAIVQSGEPRTLAPELASRVRDTFVAHLGLGSCDVHRLRALPVGALIDAQRAVFRELGAATGLMPFHPTYDRDLVDVDPITGFAAGRARGIDLVIGTTRDELRLFPDPRARDLDDDGLVRLVSRLAGGGVDARRIVGAYRAERPDRTTGDVWEAARTDAVLRVPALRVADGHTAGGAPTFVYRFDWEAPGIGAAHAVDVPFTFGNFDRDGWGEAVGADDDAERLSHDLRAAWLAFASTGDPSHPGIGQWPGYDALARPTMLFAPRSRVQLDPAGEARAAWGA